MSEFNAGSLAFLFLSLLIPVVVFILTRSHPPTKTRCPQTYPIIGNVIGLIRNRHCFHDWITDMISQTPTSTLKVHNFLNLSRGICTANPVNVEYLLVSRFQNYIKGARYENLYELLGHGIFGVDGHLWTLQRKIASHEFSTNSLKHFISDVVKSEISNRLMPHLSTVCNEGKIIDIQEVLQKVTFTNICSVAFGVDPELSHSNLAFVKAFDDAVENIFSRLVSPLPAIWKIKRFFNVGSEKRFREAIKTIDDYAMTIIETKEQQQNGDQSQDLLSRFMASISSLEFQDQEHKRQFLRDIVISFILAGKDSTSTALTWFFWLIAGDPRCESLITAELLSAPMPGKTGPRIFSYDELKKMQYLHAALSESMRLFPPVPLNSRVAVEDDVLPDGTHVGKGWFADYSAYAMGRMAKLWGEDCLEFRPERWLDGDGVFQPPDQFRYPVFHCGPRMCLGKEMAYVQMKSIAAAIMCEFEIVAVDGGGRAEKMKNPPYALSLLLKMRGGFPIKLKRRQKWPNRTDQSRDFS